VADAGTSEQLALLPEAPRPPRARSGLSVLAWVLAGVFFVATVLLAIVAADLQSDKDEVADTSQDVAEVATDFVDALLSYDHRDPEGYRERVLALTAAPFRAQFEEAVDGLEEEFQVAQQVSVPTIKDLFLPVEVGEADAEVIVVYDRVVRGAAGDRQERNLYVRLRLVRLDEGWRINDVVNLNFAFAGATTTTTTG
jgi:hypothetical protein